MTTIHVSTSLSCIAFGSTRSNFSARIWHMRSHLRRASWASVRPGVSVARSPSASPRDHGGCPHRTSVQPERRTPPVSDPAVTRTRAPPAVAPAPGRTTQDTVRDLSVTACR